VAAELYESIWKITVGATVVLDYEDYMDGMLQCDAQPEVDAAAFVGGNAATFERPNIFHQFTWTTLRMFDSPQQAAAFQLSHSIALKSVAGQDAVIQIQNHSGSITLNKATMVSFPSALLDRFVRVTYTMLGGALSGELAEVNGLLLEGGGPLVLEDDSLLSLEGDGI
jgi:hypothetical protein